MHSIESKECRRCGLDKPLSEYHQHPRMADGHLNICKGCRAQSDREHRERNAEKLREKRRLRREKNREAELARGAEYRAKPGNAEKQRAYNKEYYQKNKERLKARTREWAAANSDRKKTAAAKYRDDNRERLREWHRNYGKTEKRRSDSNHKNRMRAALKRSNGLKLTAEQVDARMSYFGYRCWMCGGDGAEVDHVKPLSKGGAHMLCNLRPACRSCNSSKNDQWPYNTTLFATSNACTSAAGTR